MNVIAEGVETDEQLRALRGMKCKEGQGYRFSHPMDARSMGLHLSEQLVSFASTGGADVPGPALTGLPGAR